jgi:hypothetical protein
MASVLGAIDCQFWRFSVQLQALRRKSFFIHCVEFAVVSGCFWHVP